ncbi:DC1I1 protein, partial [Hemiprocne comata]|nr:DC1I1 protein [Hemiprocne comata]
QADLQQKKEPTQEDSDLDRKRRETEALLQSIGISPEPPLVPTPMSPSSKSVSTPSDAGSQDSGDLGPIGRTLQWDTDPSVLQLQSDSELGRRLHKLGVSKITQVDFLPREVVSYSKETQTPLATHQSEGKILTFFFKINIFIENKCSTLQGKSAPASALHRPQFLQEIPTCFRVESMGYSMDICFGILISVGCREMPALPWPLHRLQRNLCSDPWRTSFPCFFSYLAAYRTVSYTSFCHSSLYHVVFCPFLNVFQSSVMSVCFARFHPNLVVGGTYSGQIVLWDNRSHRRTPVQRTPLSAAAHTHPVYCVNVVGTQNAHNLITVSTDGKMCSWSLDMLSTPQESMELVYNKSKPVAVTGMAFPTGDVNNFVVGSEEGTVYTACRHGSKAGIGEIFEGHQGPVTGINCHMAVGPIDFSHLFVTSSFDWTVKLWTTKVRNLSWGGMANATSRHSELTPGFAGCLILLSFLFLLFLQVPTASVTIEGASALNRVRWAQAGKEVAVGDSEGRIWIYDVGELAVPHNDEWTRFARTLVEIRANRADSEEEGAVELSA